ncbi:MAG: ABC transporter permease [Eubacteriales bacterium]|nr:ABC transporter permease [Christensenellaceae bacterium]MDY4695159.1 ABC transporter permease [Eubacteriales bacterium]
MKLPDLLRTAFLNLWRRKLRAFLTVLGMVIGTSSIVVMVSLGVGMRQSMIDSYASMGSLTNITVNNYRYVESSDGQSSTYKEVKLDKKAVDEIRKIPGVEGAMPQITAWGMAMSGKYATDVSIMGIDMEQAELFGIKLEEGEYPGNKLAGGKVQMLLPYDFYNNFYDPNANRWSPAIDKDGNPKITSRSRLKLTFDYSNVYTNQPGDPGQQKGKIYTLVPTGMLEESGNDFSWYCIMDIKVLEKLAKENPNYISLNKKNYNQVIVKCKDIDDVLTVKAKIEEMGFGASCIQEWLQQSEEQLKQTQYLLGAIGGVSLLVAAIGIMNTMMMSIYERTKEIGIIKVLGCRMSNIAGLFLTEAAYIGFFGGALGLGLSYGLSLVLNNFLESSGFKSIIPLYLAVGALAFSVVVALISGLYPAMRAMKLSPLAAIRNE